MPHAARLIKASLAAAAVFAFTACSNLQISMTPSDTFAQPADQLDVKGLGQFASSKTILVPTNYIQTMVSGLQKASNNGAHSKVTVHVQGMTVKLGQELADALYDDLVTRLRKDGWKVLTYDDIKSHADMADIDVMKPDDDLGFTGFEKDYTGWGDKNWMLSSPKGVPVFDFDFTGNWPPVHEFQSIAADLGANAILPRYVFLAPVMYSESGRGYKRSNAVAGLYPGIELQARLTNLMFSGGSITPNTNLSIAQDVGNIEEVSSASSQDVSLFDFNVFRSMAKGDYIMKLNVAAYKKAVLQAGKDLNKAAVEALHAALPKTES